MRLDRLSLRKFKGVKEYDFVPGGRNAAVFGRNATFKSTLFDAYTWLLFGKDSRGSATFEVRPVDGNGEPEHRGEHAVEATFLTDQGDLITLRRELRERWVRVRGRAFPEYKGTETSYYVNGAPVKAAEFAEAVADLFGGEKNAQVLSDPLHFAGVMPWQERRRALLALADDVTEAQVIASDPELAPLTDLLEGRDVATLHEVAKAKARDLKRKLDQYPGQIREASRHADPAAPTVEQARAEVERLEAESAEAAKVAEVARAAERKAYEAMQEARIAFATAQAEAKNLAMARRAEIESEIRDVRRQMNALIERGNRIKDEGECEVCGRPLDKEHAARERKRLRKEYDALSAELATLQGKLDEVTIPEVDASAFDKAKRVHQEAVAALAEVEQVSDTTKLAQARERLRAAELAAKARERVAELKAEEREVAEAYEDAEHVVALCEAFTRAKVRLVEAAINARFRTVRWKLFEEQVNGGIKEVAEATVNGVPWLNLNTGARINAGLEIIDVLADASDRRVPVWIDNAEALTSVLPIDSQVIQLRVSEDDSELRVVLEQPRREEKAA